MNIQALLLAVWLALPAAAWCAQPSQAADRERMAQERREAEARYLERQRECQARFVVTSCMDAAKRERREVLEALRHRQLALDEAARRERAVQRLDEIRSKKDNQDRRAAASAAAATPTGSPEPQSEEKPPREVGVARQPTRRDAARAASAAQRTERYHKRQAEAATHRALVEQRNASQAANGKPVAPLPVPAASVSSRREKPAR